MFQKCVDHIYRMKSFCFISLLFLTSCVNLTFDSLEYDRNVTIREQIIEVRDSCGTTTFLPKLSQLHKEVDHQLEYSVHRASREGFAESISVIDNMIHDIQQRYNNRTPVSVEYCKIKTNNMLVSINIVINQMGKL